ncbi:hypothetical protein C9374_014317, partial [Naegleria lovaniensis]
MTNTTSSVIPITNQENSNPSNKFHHYSSPRPNMYASLTRFGASSQNVNLSSHRREVLQEYQQEQPLIHGARPYKIPIREEFSSQPYNEYSSPSGCTEHHSFYSTSVMYPSSGYESHHDDRIRMSNNGTLNYPKCQQQQQVSIHPQEVLDDGKRYHPYNSAELNRTQEYNPTLHRSASSSARAESTSPSLGNDIQQAATTTTSNTHHLPPSKIAKKSSSSKKKVIKRKYQYKHLLAAEANKNGNSNNKSSSNNNGASNLTPNTQYVYGFGLWEGGSTTPTATTTTSSIQNHHEPNVPTFHINHSTTCSSHLKQQRAQRRAVSSITKHEMLQVLHLTQQKASQILGCSLSTVKRRFYELKDEIGLNKWPQDYLELMHLEVFQKIYPMSLHFILNHSS